MKHIISCVLSKYYIIVDTATPMSMFCVPGIDRQTFMLSHDKFSLVSKCNVGQSVMAKLFILFHYLWASSSPHFPNNSSDIMKLLHG